MRLFYYLDATTSDNGESTDEKGATVTIKPIDIETDGHQWAELGSSAADSFTGFDTFDAVQTNVFIYYFLPDQGLQRGPNDPFIQKTITSKWANLPTGVRNFDWGNWWANFAAHNGDHNGYNQRLPGGFHVTTDTPGGPVNAHFDYYDPTNAGNLYNHLWEQHNNPVQAPTMGIQWPIN